MNEDLHSADEACHRRQPRRQESAESPLIESPGRGVAALIASVRSRSRERRGQLFRDAFHINAHTRILDLGGSNGAHVNHVLRSSGATPSNVTVADISRDVVGEAHSRFGYTPCVIEPDCPVPFEDRYFDVVFCSSVLEHVTIPKEEVWLERSGRRFTERSGVHQTKFAKEIRRLGKGYFVQVPFRWFPVEVHSWLPLFSYLPRRVQVPVMRLSNRFWIKQTMPDFYVPSRAEMRAYFPDARIVSESTMGLTKSLIAIRPTASS